MTSKYILPPLPDITLTELLLSRVKAHGDRPALIDGPSGRTIKFDELEPMIRKCAAGLAARGLGKGDVIGLLSPNSIDYPIALFGAATVGATVTTLNPLYTPFEISRQLKDANARQLYVSGPLLEKAYEAVALGADLTRVYSFDELPVLPPEGPPLEAFSALLESQDAPPAVGIEPSTDVVFIPYSSGTSGMPKGVELTHRNLVANVLQAMVASGLGPDDTVVGVLPFYHIYGFTVILNVALCAGSTIVTMPSFEPVLFLKILKEHDITVAHVAPPLVGFLARHPAVEAVLPLPRLAELFSGAAPLGKELEDAARQRLGCVVRQGYGMTEASPVTHIMPMSLAQAGVAQGAVGELVPGMECKLIDLNGAPVGVGERGEICLRGPNIMKGYLNRPEANAESFDADGFYKTGDVGFVDEDGLYYVVDRVKELIKVKGFQVPPAELEDVLLGSEAIADAAVIGVACAKHGEVPKAFVVRQSGHESVSALDISSFLVGKVAEYKLISAENVEFVQAVPKSAAGKILRKELRALEASSRARS
uniref:4-coumarate--CoA ligase n=1 Tax=Coccolithus braarudii TaxID=221442 RepID=A0A7S0L8F5_9EUKA